MKLLFVLLAIAYGGVGIWGMLSYDYIDLETYDALFKSTVVLFVILSIIVGIGFSQLFKKAFPKGWDNQSRIGKVSVVLFMMIVCLIVHRGFLLFVNGHIGNQERVIIKGTIEKKLERRLSRGGREHTLVLKLDEGLQVFKLDVSGRVYYRIGEVGDQFIKEFKKGSLGVIYRQGI